MHHTSLIAQIALGLWIPLSAVCFLLMRSPIAALVIVLGGDLFLPELAELKLPMLPQFDKQNIPYFCVLVGCLLRSPARVKKLPQDRWIILITVVLFAGAVLTGLTNTDMVVRKYQPTLPSLTLRDGLYMAALNFTRVSLPLFVGYVVFRSPKDFRSLLAGFAIAAVVYVPFILFEVRMSPQLHLWVYGYHQHSFDQTRRWGGFRPMVFMSHGLSLARFLLVATFASFVLGRVKRAVFGVPSYLIGTGLLVVLIACKSTGAIVFAILGIPLLLWGGGKLHLRIAMVLALFVVTYPLLRSLDLLPTEDILQTSRSLVGTDRTGSLEFRFRNENILLERARQRFVLGWGQYARNFAFDHDGRRAVADGYWVIQLGTLGVVGFLASFGALLIPIFVTRRRLRSIRGESDRRLVSGLALTIAVVGLDWIPNGLWSPYPYLLAGALTGVTRELMHDSAASSASTEGPAEWLPAGEIS